MTGCMAQITAMANTPTKTGDHENLAESVQRMNLVLLMCIDTYNVRSEVKTHQSITQDEFKEIGKKRLQFNQHLQTLMQGHFNVVPVSMLESDFGELYVRLLELAKPWQAAWQNMHHAMMIGWIPHSVYGLTIKTAKNSC